MIDEKILVETLKKMEEGIRTDIYGNHPVLLERVIDFIQDFPKADEWIPVSERLPKSEDKYAWFKCNVTIMRSHWPTSSYDVCDSPYDEYFVTEAMYDTCQKIWHIGDTECLNALIDIEDSPLNGDYVIAWQDLPEPYKGE